MVSIVFLEEVEGRFHQNHQSPVDKGHGAVGFQLSLAVVGVDNQACPAHEVYHADEEHDGGVL